ncbi:hypothetical protein [Roseateles sp. BYS87W]|uniref:Uncharacterized protein n=1 Tax=Pelomonas baiyunensis TaxID=3299026 RepID=A0ABW7H0B5_9BURK
MNATTQQATLLTANIQFQHWLYRANPKAWKAAARGFSGASATEIARATVAGLSGAADLAGLDAGHFQAQFVAPFFAHLAQTQH